MEVMVKVLDLVQVDLQEQQVHLEQVVMQVLRVQVEHQVLVELQDQAVRMDLQVIQELMD